jgi:hypothetical protein
MVTLADGRRFGTGFVSVESDCVGCGVALFVGWEAYVGFDDGRDVLCRWCGLDVERGVA